MGRDQDDLTLLLERSRELGVDAPEAGAAATRANRADKDIRSAWEAVLVAEEAHDKHRHGSSPTTERALLRAYQRFAARAAQALDLPGVGE